MPPYANSPKRRESGSRTRARKSPNGKWISELPDGEFVISDEHYFFLEAGQEALSRDGWTAHEIQVMAEHKWWSEAELAQTSATVWPENLPAMLAAARARKPAVS